MAQWMKFSKAHDHQWPSGAMTAFEAGSIAFVKDEVAERALAMNAAEATEKPADGEETPTPTAEEGKRAPKRG